SRGISLRREQKHASLIRHWSNHLDKVGHRGLLQSERARIPIPSEAILIPLWVCSLRSHTHPTFTQQHFTSLCGCARCARTPTRLLSFVVGSLRSPTTHRTPELRNNLIFIY